MISEKTVYIRRSGDERLIKTELLFAPVLIILPIIVSILLIKDWFYRGFSMGISTYDGELFLAVIILVGNIVFDVLFIKALITLSRK